jgi:hypothetical protein
MSWQLAEHRIGIVSANRYDNRFLKDDIYIRHVASHSIVTAHQDRRAAAQYVAGRRDGDVVNTGPDAIDRVVMSLTPTYLASHKAYPLFDLGGLCICPHENHGMGTRAPRSCA